MVERFESIYTGIGLKENETGKEYVYFSEEVIRLLNDLDKELEE